MEMPMPVVVCSGLAEKGTELALSALAMGAVEVITKPKLGVRDFLHESAVMLLDAVWSAAHAKVRRPIFGIEHANGLFDDLDARPNRA